jgi:gas vesicle protein
MRRRDELRLKMHLAKADAKAEWEKAEQKWERIQKDLDRAEKETGETVDDIRKGVKTLADEVSDAYKRIRSTISA